MDRLNYFPDDVIGRILSFLPTKEAVKTSILSPRWKNHWKSITHLNFDDGYPNRLNPIIPKSEQGSFVNFVYRVLLSKSTTLVSFRLKCGEYLGWLAHAHYWICVALSRQVREIDITILTYGIRLPLSPWSPLMLNDLFLSTNLVVLKLGRGFKLIVPDIISLPKLETLHLSSVEFEDSESFTRLVSSCPLLVELKLHGTISKPEDEDGKVYLVNISSRVLKRLILRGLYYKYYTVQIVLNTPLLEYLKHVDYGVPDTYRLEIDTLQFLDRASLSLPLKSEQYDLYSSDDVLSVSMENLVLLVSHVRSLWLTKYTFEAFCHPILMAEFQLPIFSRLIDLRIGAIASNEGLNLLKAYLQASPQLTLVSFSVKVDPMQGVWNPPGALPVCMQQNLSVVHVTSFTWKPLELNMVKFFLQHTTRLNKLILQDAKKEVGGEEFHALIDKIHAFPKASKSCEIVIT